MEPVSFGLKIVTNDEVKEAKGETTLEVLIVVNHTILYSLMVRWHHEDRRFIETLPIEPEEVDGTDVIDRSVNCSPEFQQGTRDAIVKKVFFLLNGRGMERQISVCTFGSKA